MCPDDGGCRPTKDLGRDDPGSRTSRKWKPVMGRCDQRFIRLITGTDPGKSLSLDDGGPDPNRGDSVSSCSVTSLRVK